MFDLEIQEVYSVDQEVPEHGETPKKIGQIHDIRRCGPIAPVASELLHMFLH